MREGEPKRKQRRNHNRKDQGNFWEPYLIFHSSMITYPWLLNSISSSMSTPKCFLRPVSSSMCAYQQCSSQFNVFIYQYCISDFLIQFLHPWARISVFLIPISSSMNTQQCFLISISSSICFVRETMGSTVISFKAYPVLDGWLVHNIYATGWMTFLDAWGMGMNEHFDEKTKQNAIHMDEFQVKTHPTTWMK